MVLYSVSDWTNRANGGRSRAHSARSVIAVLGTILACSPDIDDARVDSTAQAVHDQSQILAPRAHDSRQSVVLFVVDTLRADAVSSYGSVEGTTPTIDRLTEDGIRYVRAYAPGPWTIPSHATLFSGLRIDEHGIGLDAAQVMPESIQTLAEDFREAGYLTAGFSENMLVSNVFGFDQGFDVYESTGIFGIRKKIDAGLIPSLFDVLEGVKAWNRDRDRSRPFFLFVNILDSHDPFLVRENNPWIPEKVRRDEAEFIQKRYPVPLSLCDRVPSRKHLEVLRGLYHGNVSAADAKLNGFLRIFDDEWKSDPPLLIVTSDHGEHFGESRLMGHRFSVGNAVLQVPLIISGLEGAAAATIDRPVELRQIRQSVLCWALRDSCPASLPITNTMAEETGGPVEPIIGIFSDSVAEMPKWLVQQLKIPNYQPLAEQSRAECGGQDRVLGDMVSVLRYPMKITWFENYDPTLHDLSWDPMQRFDQMERQPGVASDLRAELEKFVRLNVIGRDHIGLPEISEEGLRALRSLGYIQ